MSYSIPVLVTKVGGNISIGNYCNTILSSNFNSNQLYNYMYDIHHSKEYREKLKSDSYNYWLKNHNSDTISLKIKKEFETICFNKSI